MQIGSFRKKRVKVVKCKYWWNVWEQEGRVRGTGRGASCPRGWLVALISSKTVRVGRERGRVTEERSVMFIQSSNLDHQIIRYGISTRSDEQNLLCGNASVGIYWLWLNTSCLNSQFSWELVWFLKTRVRIQGEWPCLPPPTPNFDGSKITI